MQGFTLQHTLDSLVEKTFCKLKIVQTEKPETKKSAMIEKRYVLQEDAMSVVRTRDQDDIVVRGGDVISLLATLEDNNTTVTIERKGISDKYPDRVKHIEMRRIRGVDPFWM